MPRVDTAQRQAFISWPYLTLTWCWSSSERRTRPDSSSRKLPLGSWGIEPIRCEKGNWQPGEEEGHYQTHAVRGAIGQGSGKSGGCAERNRKLGGRKGQTTVGWLCVCRTHFPAPPQSFCLFVCLGSWGKLFSLWNEGLGLLSLSQLFWHSLIYSPLSK